MAHRKREQWAAELAAQTGWPIVWDTKNDVWDTARRAWLRYDPDAAHHVVIQDDAVLCAGFAAGLPAVLAHTPADAPVAFCTVDYRMKAQHRSWRTHVESGAPFFRSTYGLSGVAVSCPTTLIGAMVAHGDALVGNPHDDLKMTSFWRARKQPIWFTIPSLADHRTQDSPSLLKGHDRHNDRSASTFDPAPPTSHKWEPNERTTRMFEVPRKPQVTYMNLRTGKTQTVQADSKAAVAFDAARGWARVGAEPTFTADDVMVPPKVGRGSARDAWAAYAELHGVPYTADSNRDAIIAACEEAGVA